MDVWIVDGWVTGWIIIGWMIDGRIIMDDGAMVGGIDGLIIDLGANA